MRLAAKLVLLFLVGLLLIVGVFAYLTVQQNQRLAALEHERHATDLAAALRPALRAAWERGEWQKIDQILQHSTQQMHEVSIRWVEIEGGGDPRLRPHVPVERIVTTRSVTTVAVPASDGGQSLYTYVPLLAHDGRTASIEVSATGDEATKGLRESLVASGISLAAVSLLSGLVICVGGFWMVGRPLNSLIEKIHRVGEGDFGSPVAIGSNDELGRLGVALNQMCAQLEAQRDRIKAETASRVGAVQQLRHADRLNTVGRLAAGVAHELGTPLSVVAGRAELISSGQLSERDTKKSATVIKQEADRIAKTIRRLLDFARRSTPQRTTVDLREALHDTVVLMEALAKKQGVELALTVPDRPAIAEVDAGQIQQVVTNLVLNAVQATRSVSDAGRVDISLRAGEPWLRIQISDTGPGIAKQDQQQIFEPFFTTKDVGEGTGLGLSIAHGIIAEHDGWIDLESEPGRGSHFTVFLPVKSAAGDTLSPRASEVESSPTADGSGAS